MSRKSYGTNAFMTDVTFKAKGAADALADGLKVVATPSWRIQLRQRSDYHVKVWTEYTAHNEHNGVGDVEKLINSILRRAGYSGYSKEWRHTPGTRDETAPCPTCPITADGVYCCRTSEHRNYRCSCPRRAGAWGTLSEVLA